MEKKYKIEAYSSGFGIYAYIDGYVTFDKEKETYADFYKKACAVVHSAGYTPLHWTSINDACGAKCLMYIAHNEKYKPLCDKILDLCDKQAFYNEAISAIEKSMNAKTREEFEEGVWLDSNEEWNYAGGFGYEKLKALSKENKLVLDTICDTLRLTGIDVDDEEGQKMILNNLGFNRD